MYFKRLFLRYSAMIAVTLVAPFYLTSCAPAMIYFITQQSEKNSEKKQDLASQATYLSDTLVDVDGNGYHTVKIGDQIWTSEDFRARHFCDKTEIQSSDDSKLWDKYQSPLMYESNRTASTFYNWAAVSNPTFAPAGWRVPTVDDYNKLIRFAGGEAKAGMALKKRSGNWNEIETAYYAADNQTGFSARGNGYYEGAGLFNKSGVGQAGIAYYGMTRSSASEDEAYMLFLWGDFPGSSENAKARIEKVSKAFGCSVRLIKE